LLLCFLEAGGRLIFRSGAHAQFTRGKAEQLAIAAVLQLLRREAQALPVCCHEYVRKQVFSSIPHFLNVAFLTVRPLPENLVVIVHCMAAT
jgi:hypothetical protein